MDELDELAASEMLFILENLPADTMSRIPLKMWEFLRESSDPLYKVNIDMSRPIFDQELRPETDAWLGLIALCYLVDTDAQRRELLNCYRANEGLPPCTEEEYQEFLDNLEPFNSFAGPLPDWETSRAGRRD